ncbi:MAG: hypothetical protein QOK43_1612 [Acidimicrobiaceae bacterium]|nr:hypothetical protein [Acidimicrobiaceae bacterium]
MPADPTDATHAADATHATDSTEAGGPAPGDGIIRASWLGTGALAVVTLAGAVVPAVDIVALVVAAALFLAGTVLFFAAFVKAVDRSRTEEIGVMNVFFLDHSAPRSIRRSLLGSFAVEIAVAVAAAAVRPNTSLAFGILAPVYGLALAGLWGARHGAFPARTPKTPKTRETRETRKSPKRSPE